MANRHQKVMEIPPEYENCAYLRHFKDGSYKCYCLKRLYCVIDDECSQFITKQQYYERYHPKKKQTNWKTAFFKD